MCFSLLNKTSVQSESMYPCKEEEVMKKVKDGKQSGKTKVTPKAKKDKNVTKAKTPVISNYFPEELPKR